MRECRGLCNSVVSRPASHLDTCPVGERGTPVQLLFLFWSVGFFFHIEISRSGCSCAREPGNIVSYLSEKSDAVERETEMLDLYNRLCIRYVRLNLHPPGAIGRVSRSGARSSHAQESRVVREGTLLKSPTTDDQRTGAGSTRCTQEVSDSAPLFPENALRALCIIFSMKEGKHEV